ncbi:type II toxin-antitoxin system HicB family antitoxin [Mongoliimonas terrestris]|uniref:type II toxin-antitoxin system HicB family antitoxin n=1 Tax=Mongoliimonas terrestris TaxID=1709001 RepID=UPI0009499BF5|nr:type II toxin-antitoxin system HicB family antitoxin [Mongoliimonas terrestris]
MATYIGIVHGGEGAGYGLSFPDLPGCVTASENLDELRALAEEALALHVEGMLAEGLPVPQPSPLATVMAAPQSEGGIPLLVPLKLAAKTVRVNITLPEEALRDIDTFAESHGYSRSGFLVSAARKFMAEAAE